MDAEMVTPSQLHRDLERAKVLVDERSGILSNTLRSGNLAVIRRIPELLMPLSVAEMEMVAEWAAGLTRDQDVSNRDFAFHLMVNCAVPAERILAILEQNNTFSRTALEHIQGVLMAEGPVPQLDAYLRQVAESLLSVTEVSPRDRGRHMLMTLVRDESDWLLLAKRFSETEIIDLRQRVLERFLQECPDGSAMTLFIENVTKMCLDSIRQATIMDVYQEVSNMHWVLMCLERGQRKTELTQVASLFKTKFGTSLPRSVRYKIETLFPTVRVKRVYEPYSVDEALDCGWTIRKESGKQVVLIKDGRSITRHRS